MKKKGDKNIKNNNSVHDKSIQKKQTDNNQTEEALRSSEEKFALAFKHSPIGICLSSLRDGCYLEVNDVYSNFLGYSREELIGRTSFDINLWVDTAERDALLREIFQKGTVNGFELRFRDKKGEIHWGYVSAAIVKIREESYLLTQTQDITDKKKLEKEFDKSESMYRLLADHMQDQIWLMDLDLNFTFTSPSVVKVSGFTPDEFIIKPLDKHLTEESLRIAMEVFEEEMSKASKNLMPPNYFRTLELEAFHKDGHIFPVETTVSFINDENGKPLYILGESRNITKRKEAEQSLKKSEERYRIVADNVTDGIFTMDMNFNYTYASPSAYNIVGYTADELITMKVEQLVDSETLSWFAEIFAEELETEKRSDKNLKRSRVLEYQHVRKDGSKVWVETKLTFLRDENNKALGVLGIVRDITERKKTKDTLFLEGERFRALADYSLDIIILIDTKGVVTYINPAVERILGFKVEERLGRSSLETIHPDDLEASINKLKILATNLNSPVLQMEMRLRHKDGSWRTFETVASNLVKDNTVETIIIRQRDITERKVAEEKLRREEQLFRSVTEQSTDIIVIANPEGMITYHNPAIEKVLGYKVGERYGHSGFEIVHPDDFNMVMDAYKILFNDVNTPVQKGEVRFRHKNGSWKTFEISGSNLVHNNVIEAAIINMHDITERKKAEESLRQSEEKYRLLADHMKDQVWVMDMDLKLIYISPSVEKLMGYTLQDIKEIPLHKLLTLESFEVAMEFFSIEMPKALAAPSDYILTRSLELEFRCKDGRTVWGETMFSFIRDENGKPLSLLGEGREITERKQVEDALKKSEENFRRSLDDSPLGVRISTMEGKTIYANKTILDIYGYDNIEELQNTPLQERYTPESYAEFQARKKKRLQGEFGPSEYEISIVRKNGEIRHLHVFRKEIFWSGQKQSQVIYQDITLRRQTEEKLNETLESLRQSIKITIQVLGTASEAKDPYMAGHQKRVADLARAIGTEMKLPHDKIEAIRMASAIHDIGKISVPAEILCKPAILNDLEFSLVKNHPFYSYEIIKEVESPWPLADIVHQHHERIDGSGYPQGLKNGDILIESRILAVADVVEAMMSYRPYRPALELKIALAEIENNAGILYDRDVVNACLRLFRQKGYHIA